MRLPLMNSVLKNEVISVSSCPSNGCVSVDRASPWPQADTEYTTYRRSIESGIDCGNIGYVPAVEEYDVTLMRPNSESWCWKTNKSSIWSRQVASLHGQSSSVLNDSRERRERG